MQTDEEMLERVLQNSGYPGNGLRHDHQQLACSSLVFMIGLPELSLMTLVSEESPSKEGSQNIHRLFYLVSSFNCIIIIISGHSLGVVACLMLCFELRIKSCAACPLFLIFL